MDEQATSDDGSDSIAPDEKVKGFSGSVSEFTYSCRHARDECDELALGKDMERPRVKGKSLGLRLTGLY